MIGLEKITAVSNNPLIIEFAEFVITESGSRGLPNVETLDILKVARLVKHIWKIKYDHSGERKMDIVFSGTANDDFWKTNTMKNRTVDDLYTGDDYKDLIPKLYRKSLEDGRVAYSRRMALFDDVVVPRHVNIEAIFFPGSTDGKIIDSGIGLVDYSAPAFEGENVYMHLS